MECISAKMMRCNRIIANIFRKHLIGSEITNSQLGILFFVAKSKDVTQKDISEFLKMEKSTVNRNIQRLLTNGYLACKNNTLLYTTTKGNETLESIIPLWNKAMSEAEKALGDAGISSLNIIHTKLNKSHA